MEWLMLILVAAILSIIAILLVIQSVPGHFDIDWMEMDRATCEQMREDGCSEEEIKEFMSQNGGSYFGPNDK